MRTAQQGDIDVAGVGYGEGASMPGDDSTEQERSLQALVAAVSGVLYEAEAGEWGRWLFVSHRIEQLLGYSPEEWLADPNLWFESVHADDRDALSEMEHEALRGNMDVSVLGTEYRMTRQDGEVIWVRDDARLDPSADPPIWRGALCDITASRRAQQLLTNAVERSQNPVEASTAVLPPGGVDVFRLECAECDAVWAASQVESCRSCSADSVQAMSVNALQAELEAVQKRADDLLRGVEDHLFQLETSKRGRGSV